MRTRRVRRLRELASILDQAAVEWMSDNASSMGAALAYYTLFSLAPILVISIALAGAIFGADVAQRQILSELPTLLGDTGAAAVRELLLSAHYSDKRGLAAVIGVITLVVGAMSVFSELQNALERVWKTPKAAHTTAWGRMLRMRLVALGMVLGIGFLLLVSLIASAAISALSSWLDQFLAPLHLLLTALDFLLSFGMTVVLFAIILKYGPRERIAWQDVWVGAAATGFLFTIGKMVIGLYIGHSSFSSAYGAAGSLVVLLLWIYYSAQIFLFGAEFTRAYTYARGSRSGGRPRPADGGILHVDHSNAGAASNPVAP